MDGGNVLARQRARLHTLLDCAGESTEFESAANEFLGQFAKFKHNTISVELCGRGTFFYFQDPDMNKYSVLGHVSRCGKPVTKAMNQCSCHNLPEGQLTESFTLEYC